ncbi:cysteine dioxygenase [Cupriavidus basilensis]
MQSRPATATGGMPAIRAGPLGQLAPQQQATFAHEKRAAWWPAISTTWLPDTDTLLACLPPGALLGNPDTYTRHLVYADPLARFSAMLLVWRRRQSSPVHRAPHLKVRPIARPARHPERAPLLLGSRPPAATTQVGGVERRAGATFSVPADLQHIHALGNASDADATTNEFLAILQEDATVPVARSVNASA